MNTHTHTSAEWAAFLSLGVSGGAIWTGLFLLVVDADLEDFDPRPALRRVVESPAADRVLIAVTNARHNLREAALTAAALLMLLTARPEALR
ncbi:hypothetical protein WKI71_36840 [Streptomyces sp. MS1.AVA.1]|uniref:Uncharacterized protein n=1 Tax=Streptomyces machairae TaxID=3134109 RepID=A0ABU8USP0_9ACTN